MEAPRFLRPGRVAPFTGVTWPPPGQWLAAAAPPELCRAGVHALLPDVLATWIAQELWHVELDGGQELVPGIVVAARGRLLGRVEAWNDETAGEFARACAAHVQQHARDRAAEYAADAAAAADRGGCRRLGDKGRLHGGAVHGRRLGMPQFPGQAAADARYRTA
jgi:hypothetical protein